MWCCVCDIKKILGGVFTQLKPMFESLYLYAYRLVQLVINANSQF